MKHKALILLLILLCENNVRAGGGLSDMQAICKVTLANGKSIEGFIKLGTGRNEGLWMNGFNVEEQFNGQPKYNAQFLFDLDFRFFRLNDSSVLFNNGSSNTKGAKRKIKFLQWVENPSIYEPEKLLTTDDSIVIIKHIERHYLLIDSITIYNDLNPSTYLDTVAWNTKTSKRIVVTRIAVKDISTFEIIEHPSQEWLVKIENAKKSFDEDNGSPDSTGDGIPAIWFHELIANKELYDYYQPRINYFIGKFPR